MSNQRRILVLNDLHAPFIREGALEFSKSIRDKYQCNEFMCVGDEIDVHASSFHDSEVDAMNADDELSAAKEQLALWHNEFPGMKIAYGNHSLIYHRKMNMVNLPSRLQPNMADLLETPTWTWHHEIWVDDNTKIVHGVGKRPHIMAKELGINVIAGHTHSQTYIRNEYLAKYGMVFAMQLGSFMDSNSYAARYARSHMPSIPSIGVLIQNEQSWTPILEILNK